jgi:hypothetical protein
MARVALLAGSVLAMLALAEGFARVFPDWFVYASMRNVVQRECTRPEPEIEFVNREGYSGSFVNREFRTLVRINSKGLRDREYPYERTPGRPRCLFLGDSFVFGWGVAAEESVAKRVEERLPGVEVIGAACSGWSSRQEVLFLEKEAIRYRPDAVLLFFCENDPYENVLHYTFVDGHLSYAGIPQGRGRELVRWFIRHSALFNLVREAAGSSVEEFPGIGSADSLWGIEEGYLREFHAFLEARGVRPAVVYVPNKNRRGLARHGSYFKPLDDFCRSEGLPLVDLVPAMSDEKKPVFYRLDDHWNPHGHEVAARVVSRFLRDSDFLEQPSRTGS